MERTFGVLQSRFAILKSLARFWYTSCLADIMYACIILHNMIVEDERDTYSIFDDVDFDKLFNYDQENTEPIQGLEHGPIHEFT